MCVCVCVSQGGPPALLVLQRSPLFSRVLLRTSGLIVLRATHPWPEPPLFGSRKTFLPSWIANSLSQKGLMVRWCQMGKGVGFPTLEFIGTCLFCPTDAKRDPTIKGPCTGYCAAGSVPASWEHLKIQYQPGVVGFATWLAGKLVTPMTSGLDYFARQFN